MKSDPSISGVGDLVPDLPRKVGFWGAIAVMVGVVIGSGIFRTPTTIAQNLGDPWLILGLWFLAGLIALCGALTFAELAAMMPRSGGVYVFLREGFGRCPAFVFGWTYMLI
ncbi:MAG: amino acid permease, partial [Planctomycetes bacterium]|nr:amino acid permease [Planctomycetota bacterium]